ncbi:MAG: Ig-like domain-containing protein [Bacteroidales bacterium]|nr:Ig-like domain-containing protein [Clostridium sp.]MCM1204047.1 Ig-like domain-containing protein [Bacteroidales bacterium]
MKKFTKSVAVALALALTLSLGTGVDVEAAAKKKATVSKVTAVDKATGKTAVTLAVGKSATIQATVTGKNLKAANKKVTFKTSNKKVATVTAKGVVKGKKNGKATITVTSKTNKKKSAKVKVTVVKKNAPKITSVKLKQTKATVTVGDKLTVKATIGLKKGAKKAAANKVVWTTSDKAVATVTAKGVVTAKKAGKATITIATTDGSAITKKCVVTVKAKPVEETKKTTVLAPKDGTVTVDVEFTNAADVQKDVNTLAKAAVKAGDDIQVTLDGKTYTATYDGTNVKINGKLFAESTTAKNAKSVKVTVAVKADKIAAAIAFAPASVTKVTVDGVAFTNITATTFKMGTKTYNYKVDGKNIVVEGDVAADFAGLNKYVTATVK